MCRLYGFLANERTKVECTLVHAQNSLLMQSRRDQYGREHADGWGIAYYGDDVPILETGATAAFSGLHFGNSAERVYSRATVAHVRLATVGTASLVNCHPFRWRRWVLAHNGTVTGIIALRPQLLREMGEELAASIRGTTDSELLFHWLISGFRRRGLIDPEGNAAVDVAALQQSLAERLAELDERCRQLNPDQAARLNVVLTDGQVLLASRLRNTLHWVHRIGLHDCEICGIPHVDHDSAINYRAVVVASEPLSHEAWQALPNGSVLAVAEDLSTRQISIPRPANLLTDGA